MTESGKTENLREDLDQLLLLLAAEPRPGFEREFEELTRREVARMFRSEPDAEEERG